MTEDRDAAKGLLQAEKLGERLDAHLATENRSELIAAQALETANKSLLQSEKLGERLDSHLKSCSERSERQQRSEDRLYAQIGQFMEERKSALTKLEGSINRVHTRIDRIQWWLIGLLGLIVLGLGVQLILSLKQ